MTTLCVPVEGETAVPAELLACTANVKVPAALGVPLNTPAVDSDRPVGCELGVTREKVGAGDPDAVNAKLYGVPTTPAVGTPLVKAGGVGAITLNATTCVAVPLAVTAETVKLTGPAFAISGFPLRKPVVEFRVNQAGGAGDADQAVTAWLAVNWCVYATFGVPFGGAALVMAGRLVMVTFAATLALGAVPLEAVTVIANGLPVLVVGVPLNTPALDSVSPPAMVLGDMVPEWNSANSERGRGQLHRLGGYR